MASFVRPFDPALVTRLAPDETRVLADPARTPGEPIIRPRVARYAGSALTFLGVAAVAPFEVRSPVTGSVRNVELDEPLPGSVNRLVEISPLPFSIAPALAKLQPGLPTFYLAYAAPAELADDVLASAAEPIANGTQFFIGVLFQDGVSLAPWAWIEMIRAAMADSGDDDAEWNTMATLYDDHRSLRVLDHTGRPASDQTFQIRIRRNDGLFDGIWVRSTGDDGDLEAAVAAEPLDRPGGLSQSSLFGAAGERTELLWRGAAPVGDITLPVQALYGTEESAGPGVPLLLPADITRGHLQILELVSWFADPPDSVQVEWFHTNSRVEPLVDGTETFRRMVVDLLASAGDEGGAHFAGWAFKDFPLVEAGELPDALGLDDATFSELIRHLVNNGASARFLVNQFVTFEQDPDTEARVLGVIVILIFFSILLLGDARGSFDTDLKGYGVFGVVTSLFLFKSASKSIREIAEQSLEIFPVLNEIRDGIAVCSEHPARLNDNPVKETPITPLGLENFINRFGTWHQKFQCFKRQQPDREGNEFIAYLGGIDIHDDRLDTPGHQIQGPYHDVHARITGRGAADVFRTFEERWGFEAGATLDLEIDTPAPNDLESAGALAAGHIVQIARTHFRGPTGTAPFTNFAGEGERTIHDTLVRAIRSAKDYIYIEDQYFVPNDRQNPAGPDVDLPDTVLDALVEAAQHCKRLIILVPSVATIGNQPFSHLRRDYAMSRLRAPEAWGDRVLIGAPMRRPVLARADRVADEGRCILMSEAGPNQDFIVFGPPSRVPGDSHLWLWVDGELMLSKGPASPTANADGKPAMRLEVLRGQAGNNRLLNASTRRHFAGAPVTMSRLKGIFVHAKTVMIDDIFVSIGSANMNRRSFFYDGEISVFAVPEQLKWAADNPARALRTALWAEQLNLPPAMGPSLLADPMAAFELFRRSPFAGNRFMNLQYIDMSPDLAFMTSPTMAIQLLTAAGIAWVDTLIDVIWNSVSDPTSFIDPDPSPGPAPDP